MYANRHNESHVLPPFAVNISQSCHHAGDPPSHAIPHAAPSWVEVLSDVLLALFTTHGSGFMARDISLENTLVLAVLL